MNLLNGKKFIKTNSMALLKSEVERIRNSGKNVVFDVDVVGGVNIKSFMVMKLWEFS